MEQQQLQKLNATVDRLVNGNILNISNPNFLSARIVQRAILNFALVHMLEILPEVLRYPRRRFTTIKCIIDEDFPKQFSTRTTRQRRKNRVKGLSDKSKLRLVFKSMLP